VTSATDRSATDRIRSFLSLSFDQPVGSRFRPGEVRGYYIDFRVKAKEPDWPPQFELPFRHVVYVAVIQWGLGCYEHYLHTGDERWLRGAVRVADYLLETQLTDGALEGGWSHLRPYPHTFRLNPPWLSGMAQGQGASLLVRLHRELGQERLAHAAVRALQPLAVPSTAGGVRAELDGLPFFEEYPTTPPSYVFNGGMFALWGLYDVAAGLGDADARRAFEEGLDGVAANISRWDTGYWSRYDLYPHRVQNVASSAYHTLHVDQLQAMQLIAPRPEMGETLERFRRYARSPSARLRALAAKIAFRLAVPRR
jgi:heparosan-N-sulfate-glucuronate 5-epimerase